MRTITSRRPGLSSEAEVLDRVHRTLGPVDVVEDRSPRPNTGRLVRIATRSGDTCFVKWYRDAPDYQREVTALTTYTPALGSDAPKLIDSDGALQMVLISEVAGEAASLSESAWDPLVHYRAGALIRTLHESAPPVISDQFARQCAARFEEAAFRLEQVVDSALLSEARVVIARAMDIHQVSLVPTHRDNHPGNWMVDSGGHVRLIDFGMSEYDPWIVDAFALEHDYWRIDPSLKVAFLSGYDREMSHDDESLLRAHHAVIALQTMAKVHLSAASKSDKVRARDMFDRLVGSTLF
ncbi:MAG: aminoglycoside phosphotransferase family protein [Microbacteriaceae bacterium]|nr:aminoglycoside phosphotransferase family protein [Microbacteriaceae bacterium]